MIHSEQTITKLEGKEKCPQTMLKAARKELEEANTNMVIYSGFIRLGNELCRGNLAVQTAVPRRHRVWSRCTRLRFVVAVRSSCSQLGLFLFSPNSHFLCVFLLLFFINITICFVLSIANGDRRKMLGTQVLDYEFPKLKAVKARLAAERNTALCVLSLRFQSLFFFFRLLFFINIFFVLFYL